MPGKITRIKDNLTLRISTNKPFDDIHKKHIITLVSIGNGINGAKWVAPEEELHIKLLEQVNEYNPKFNIILVAGLLKRRNYWEMVEQLSDDALAERLRDIPKDIDEKKLASLLAEKFIDIAENLEAKYIRTLKKHFRKNKEIINKLAGYNHISILKNDEPIPEDIKPHTLVAQREDKQLSVYWTDNKKLVKKSFPNGEVQDILTKLDKAGKSSDDVFLIQDIISKYRPAPMGLEFKIATWNQRHHYDNYDKKSPRADAPIETPAYRKKIIATKSRFLNNKKPALSAAKERMIKAQPLLAGLDFNKITDQACLQYILEEYYYFDKLSHTEVLHNGKIPQALEPIFEDPSKDLYWRDFSFKQTKNVLPESKGTEKPLTRARSTSFIDSLSSERNEEKSSLCIDKRLKFFSLSIKTTPEEKSKSEPSSSLEIKHQEPPIEAGNLSPKSSERMMYFFTVISQSPPSAEKDLAMKKIEEAAALVTMRL